MKKVFLLDGHSLIHRAYYAIPELKTKKGLFTNAAYGFSLMLGKLLEEKNPDYIAVAFDMEGPTFRHKRYLEYKATRDKSPEDLIPQFNIIRDILKAYDIPIYEAKGYEADDVIGTLADHCQGEGLFTVVITGDRDALQLVNDKIQVMYTRKGITDLVTYNEEEVYQEYGVKPPLLVDLKGLMGDPSDNIPGVDGIGKKTAMELIQEFGSLDEVLKNVPSVRGKKRKEMLETQRERAIMSRDLALIRRDVPLDLNIKEMDRGRFQEENLMKIFQELEFNLLLDRLGIQERIEVSPKDLSITSIEKREELIECLSRVQEKKELAFEVDGRERPVFYLAFDQEVFSYQEGRGTLPFSVFLSSLQEVIEDKDIKKYLVHGKETIFFLYSLGLELKGLIFEPFIAAYLIDAGGRINTFEEILEEYGLREKNQLLPRGERIKTLFLLYQKMMERIKAMGLEVLYGQVELPLVRVLVEMEMNGIKVDGKRLKEISKEIGGRLLLLRMEVSSFVGKEFNLNSPKQLGVILFEDLKLPASKKTKTGYSTAVDVLEDLKKKHPIIPLILEYRQLMKLKSTYVDSLLELKDTESDRIHTSFNQLVTATGRLSSTEPNLQNIPVRTHEGRKIRGAFIPGKPDWYFLTADYSQVELRILAHISGDSTLQEAFARNEDIHTNTAAQVFGVPMDKVTSEHRRRAKAINFGIAYGMSSFGLGKDLDIPQKEADKYIKNYFLRYPGVKRFMETTIEKAREEGCVKTLLGRTRFLPDIRSRNQNKRALAERMAINTPIQGSAADIMKLAMVEVYQMMHERAFDSLLLLQVHDELVFEAPEGEIQELGRLVREKMEGAMALDVPLVVDVKKGKNWSEMKILEL